MKNFDSINGLILAGILISGKTDLRYLLSTIDYIDRSIPTREELNKSLSIFVSLGWIEVENAKIRALRSGKKVGNKHFNFFADLFKSVIDSQLSFRNYLEQRNYDENVVDYKEYYNEENYSEALKKYEDFINRAWKINPEKQSKFTTKVNERLGFYSECRYILTKNIISFLDDGFYYKIKNNEFFLNYNDCVINFKLEKDGSGKCIGERDSTKLTYIFFTNKTKTILRCKNFKTFEHIREKINSSGFSTYDLS